ncbi:hypothetical protein BCR36DRAFT_359962 [Piromyces finnis]|uniref:LysM domain-containing protein n=1 Tax=Piromyces finnis TaxID=1754191 RepID=A0A1Y1V051_9FUNG|nr:hypothetical protein BCR36DRAFT_359962 [Piromyces finnis]|eukprot:ORX44395.1 hypothetical protein BCR36DRAFT_359962 [Piromyces finnis]
MRFLFSIQLLITLFGFIQVHSLGYHCKKYIVIKHGDRCKHMTSGFSFDKDYYITRDSLLRINPSMDCDNLRSGNRVCVEASEDYDEIDNDFEETTVIENSCAKLAKRLNTTISIIENTNNVKINCKKLSEYSNMLVYYRKDGNYDVIYDKKSKKVNIL